MQHLVAVGQVGVEQDRGEDAENGERQGGEPRLSTDDEQEAAAKLDQDHQR